SNPSWTNQKQPPPVPSCMRRHQECPALSGTRMYALRTAQALATSPAKARGGEAAPQIYARRGGLLPITLYDAVRIRAATICANNCRYHSAARIPLSAAAGRIAGMGIRSEPGETGALIAYGPVRS